MSNLSVIARPAPKIPRGVLHGREVTCIECPHPCARQHDLSHYGDPCAICPAASPRWITFGKCMTEPFASTDVLKYPISRPMRGLGDLVAKIANPIARIIRLDKSKCGCAARQEWLNNAVPFSTLPKQE